MLLLLLLFKFALRIELPGEIELEGDVFAELDERDGVEDEDEDNGEVANWFMDDMYWVAATAATVATAATCCG